jgi:prepilin-type N-terminal cleavage/methylation domain-containing protein
MKTARIKIGFTILEVLMSMVILAVLLTAVAVAFDASIVNFQANDSISKITNAGRAALLRMTTELRSAGYDSNGDGEIESSVAVSDPVGQCSLTTSDNRNICYWHDTVTVDKYGKPLLPLRLNIAGTLDPLDPNFEKNNPILCTHVKSATFDRATYTTKKGFLAVRNVRIVLTLTDDKGKNPQTLAAAAVVRRNPD